MLIEITETEAEELAKMSITAAKFLGKYYKAKDIEFKAQVLKMPTLGERLRALREYKGITKAELAQRCGVVVDTITRYENNVMSPKINKLVACAYCFNVTLDLLLGHDRTDKTATPGKVQKRSVNE